MAGTGSAEKQEQGFFDQYWPAVGALSGAATTAPPTTGQEDDANNRASKAPKNNWGGKGGREQRGSGGSRGQQKRRDREKDNWGNDWGSWTGKVNNESALEAEVEKLRECIIAMQRMILRQEDFTACLRAEISWVMFMRLDMRATVVPALFAMQQKWREMKAQTPDLLQGPMRVALVQQLFKELATRLTQFHEQAEQVETLRKLGWYDSDNRTWAYVKWDADSERLVPDATKEAIGFQKLSAILLALQQLAAIPGTIMRFHPSRPMEETMGGKNLTFCLQLCVLGDSAKQVREHLAVLTGLSVTQLVGMGLRPERNTRSSLANTIQQQIQELMDGEL